MSTHAKKAAGIQARTRNVIVQDIANVNNKIRSLDPEVQNEKKQIDRLREIHFHLIDELERLINAQFSNLENHPNIANIIAKLDAAAKNAKTEAERLKEAAESLAKFNTMLGNITKLVGGLVALA